MLLAIDIGNTRTKAAVFEGNTILANFTFDGNNLHQMIIETVKSFKSITDVVISSVGIDIIPENLPGVKIHTVSHSWIFPFTNKYSTPLTLGVDRMVLASGAVLNYPATNRLVIDSGTCITYDFIDSNDNYLGGAISPGIKLRYASLHQHTAKLPLLNAEWLPHFIGDATSNSIHSGVVNGILYEIEGFIARYAENCSNFIIILTGGDTDFLAERLKYTIFANSNFLLESLNQTFQHKIKND